MVDASMMTFVTASPQYRPRVLYFGVVAGAAQSEVLTFANAAGSTQADFVVIYNQAGESEALWLDIDADGTEPTAAEYLAADVQTMVSVTTGDSAADIGTAAAAVISIADVTVTDNLDGTLDLVQDIYGDCSDAVPYDADGSGAGSIGVSVATDGLDASMGNGKFDGTIAQTAIGVFTVSFDNPYLRAPEVGVLSKSDNRVIRVTSSLVGSVTLEVQNLSGGAAADGNFSLIVLGSDASDAIL